MIQCRCYTAPKYDPLKDNDKVIGGLAVNIDDMLQTGIVKDNGNTLDNNGIDDPESIIGLVRDVFDAMDAERIIHKYGRKPKQAQTAIVDATAHNQSQPSTNNE